MKNKLPVLFNILRLALFPIILLMTIQTQAQSPSFREQQKAFSRVKNAYAEKENYIRSLLEARGISDFNYELFIRILKKEKQLEVWVRKKGGDKFLKLIAYDICRSSGNLGPKRQEGDMQVPEGFYHINVFNPASNFHLSLGINYPNASDQKLGVKGNLGGSIFIHGDCVTIGCIPITDDKIKELYVLCVEAKNAGQANIPVHIFPCRMTDREYEKLLSENLLNPGLIGFWKNLKPVWNYFEQNNTLPQISVASDGSYIIIK